MQRIYRFVFAISKAIHKYTGLVFLLYFLFIGITGVLINHPSLLRGITVPSALLPDAYRYTDWNRMALREAVFSKTDPDTLYLAGKAGVFRSFDGGKTFAGMLDGLPTGAWNRDARALLLLERNNTDLLIAGTRSGLYFCDPDEGIWQGTENKNLQQHEIIDLVLADNLIYAFTEYDGYVASADKDVPHFKKVNLSSVEPAPDRVAMFRFLLKLHDGSILGLPGKLFVDGVGLFLLFLSVSALYIWYVPWSRKKVRFRSKPRYFQFFHKYHLKFGIYSALFLVIIALTGIFIRPPFLLSIIKVQVPAWLYPNPGSVDWHAKIQKAVYLQDEDALLLATKNGFFKSPADLSKPFEKQSIKVPVHGMGAFVLEPLRNSRLLIGSFSGIYVWDIQKKLGLDMNGKLLPSTGRKRGVRGGGMAVGAAVLNGEPLFWADYRKGVQMLENSKLSDLPMLKDIENTGMSLWHFLFECHNGRIFRGILGEYTWLFVPLGGIILLLSALTGSYDWLFRKVLVRNRGRNTFRKRL